MEQIKILFFILGTFFGINQSRVIAEKTTVTINPETKTVTIFQENLISIIQNKSDSLKVRDELELIKKQTQPWDEVLSDFTSKKKKFYIAKDNTVLNSKLTLTYTDSKDLKVFGIDINKDGKFSMTNFPKSNIKSTDGILGERYWNFETNKTFSFTTEPLTNIPEDYKKFKKSILPIWKTINL